MLGVNFLQRFRLPNVTQVSHSTSKRRKTNEKTKRQKKQKERIKWDLGIHLFKSQGTNSLVEKRRFLVVGKGKGKAKPYLLDKLKIGGR